MEFSSWPVEELEALAKVYVKHKQLHRAKSLRTELENRLRIQEDEKLKELFDQLDSNNILSLTDRIFGRAKRLA